MTHAHGTNDDEARYSVLSLGLLRPGRSPGDITEAVAAVGTADSADLLFRHKVSSISASAAQRLAESAFAGSRALLTELAGNIRKRASVMDSRWRSAEGVRRLVTGIARGEGVAWWTMKGFSFRHLYPAGCPRDVGDLDILVATVDDAWRVARRLRQDGYIYLDVELPWFKRDVRTGELYGQIRLTTPRRDRLAIDIHAGPYSVRHCAVMPLRRSGRSGPGTAIAFDDDVCAVVANAAGDRFITAKMINDLVLALDQDTDAGYIWGTLDSAGLLPFFATCLDRVAAWCELSPGHLRRLSELMPDVPPEPVPPVAAPDPAERCEVTAGHARMIAARLFPGEPEQVSAVEQGAREAYGADHPLQLADLPGDAVALPELNNWTCVRLVPVPLATDLLPDGPGPTPLSGAGRRTRLSAELTGEEWEAGTLVHAIGESFLPTVDFALSRAFVAALAPR